MNLDFTSLVVIHVAMMWAFSGLFAAIYWFGNDWRFPWHFSVGFLLSPSVMAFVALGRIHDMPSLIGVGLISGFIGPAILTMGAAKMAGVKSHPRLWAAGFGSFVVLHGLSAIADFGAVGHLVVLNLALVAFSLVLVLISREFPAEDHRLGRTMLTGLGALNALTHMIRIPVIILNGADKNAPEMLSASMIIGATILAAFIAAGAVILVAERFAAQIKREARTDDLTGLAGRRSFDEQIMGELVRWRRYQRPFTVVLFDVDRFKQVNDTYGHAIGDVALKLVASCGRSVVRPSDLLARLGGDEFALLLPETHANEGVEVAERLLQAIRSTPFAAGDDTLTVTGSFGVAEALMADDTIETIMKRADEALYVVKRRGRNGVAAWEAGTQEATNDA